MLSSKLGFLLRRDSSDTSKDNNAFAIPSLTDLGYTSTEQQQEDGLKHRGKGGIDFLGGETAGLQLLDTMMQRHHWVATFEKPKTNPNALTVDTTGLSPCKSQPNQTNPPHHICVCVCVCAVRPLMLLAFFLCVCVDLPFHCLCIIYSRCQTWLCVTPSLLSCPVGRLCQIPRPGTIQTPRLLAWSTHVARIQLSHGLQYPEF